ncbi:hypothetical protein SODALDRAFT_325976 [Sodiomyces alkalinus F11]|uniref:Mitochondrial ribosomal protein MRP51 n=1 Tax=Sodiomyces alkalinus (strain CBS 110278 / VKM F-3762 / F11) TaxID=1314773 RepID=A0A3N2Q508_SODAK|nr:hypothetical protein SODALDRAFT_325976 [Sodiomyces alkalinus F11]ROT41786.1 hypothetical protein SODALDRAFT_325976 [Sodiomyces alkalinus F11]
MSARLSPGGALLRSSRMFSIPNPIPAPTSGDVRHQLGTLAFPTHLSITTPESSRARGDWGLKRPLPLRWTAKTSTPSIRVKHIDSIENVTDYASSSEHSLTLQKFHELNLPITVPALPNRYRMISQAVTSVFEEDSDFIAPESAQGASGADKRWRFQGPWLAGMTEGEFNKYLRTTVRNKRQEFRDFLKARLASEITASQQQEALDKAADPPTPVQPRDITDEQFSQYVRRLRADRVTLFAVVSEFLDLAPLNPPSAIANMSIGARIESKSPNPYAERGPPVTHPSAGLSYLRSNAHAENHPLYGPQAHPSPVLARIISPRMMSAPAKLGVAGFITDTPQGDSALNRKTYRSGRARVPGISTFDAEIEGGAKCYVEPRSANVNSAGKVIIKVNDANEEAQVILKETIGKAEIYNAAPKTEEFQLRASTQPLAHEYQTQRGWGSRGSHNRNAHASEVFVSGSSQTYGLDR